MRVQVYEWLYSHNGAYLYPYKDIKEIEFLAKSVELNTSSQSTQYIRAEYLQQMLFYANPEPHIRWWQWNHQKNFLGNYSEPTKIKIDASGMWINDNFVSDWTGFLLVGIKGLGKLENIFDSATIRVGNVSGISYIKTDTLHLKPCKLLSPYGTHPIGECCMIDVLTNTLYFNQGSGSFSVEGEAGEIIDTTPVINNIISKESIKAVRLREWIRICKNGWINTNILPTEDIKLTTSTILPTINPWDNVLGAETIANAHNLRIGTSSGASLFINNSYFINDIKNGDKFDISIDGSQCNINGIAKSVRMLYCEYPIVLGGLNRGDSPYNSNEKLIGVTTINDHIFYPAELALPYGNHPIGTACMIDLLSGDLYFNQGSGQFTCEGAFLGYWQDKPMNDHYCDVEGTLHRSVQIFADNGERLKLIWEKSLPFTTHRWLVADGKANMPNFETKKINVKVKSNTITDKQFGWINSPYGADYKCLSELRIRSDFFILYNWNKGKPKSIYVPINQIAHLTTDGGNIFNVNGVDYDVTSIATDFTDVEMLGFSFARTNVQAVNVHISALFTDTLHLTPAVLSRPTLASEDNNGIARKQGEAVFVDEERYKQGLPWCFGNVASSGSFSVSDYLIEGEDYEVISGVKGDGLAYIQRNIWPHGLTITLNVISDNAIDDGYYLYYLRPDNYIRHYIERKNGAWKLAWNDGTREYDINTPNGLLNIDTTYINDGARFYATYKSDSEDITLSSLVTDNWTIPLKIGSPKNGVIKSLKLGGRYDINLIPVRLLRTIEPTCTHNGKGGKVGEIGFFDTISGKFYGNDGNGEFTEYIP